MFEIKEIPDWMNDEALATLNKGYLKPDETPKGLFERVAKGASKYLPDNLSEDFYKDMFQVLYRGYLGLATPVATDMGVEGDGLPISCYSVSVDDSVEGIMSSLHESAMLTKHGGGVGVYLGRVRPRGSKITTTGGNSNGVLPFAKFFDEVAFGISKGNVRRGSFALYLPVEHPDILEFLNSKNHVSGDPRRWIDSNIAVTITDEWMEQMLAGDEDKLEIFSEIIRMRLSSGSPYIVFIDNVNNANPEAYNRKNLKVECSNLCSEIVLYTDPNHTFVCCLSSLNLALWDEWSSYRTPNLGWSVPFISTVFLDCVLEEFLVKAKPRKMLKKAVASAKKGRPLGLGVLGLHTLYQKRMIPFASDEARNLNITIHSFINEESVRASQYMAAKLGEPKWCKGLRMRNTHMTAIAPTRTNSSIMGASQGIEPIESNYYVAKQDKVMVARKNPLLAALLDSKGKDTPEVWQQISLDEGSVRSLPFLSEVEKEVFLTAREIDQKELVRQAADRQPFIDQAQSLNLFFDTYASDQHIFECHIMAWKLGVKSLYYLRSKSKQNLDTLNLLITKEGCPWCVAMKERLNSLSVHYKEIDVMEAKRKGIFNYNHGTVPQYFEDGVFQGGYTDYTITENECSSCEG